MPETAGGRVTTRPDKSSSRHLPERFGERYVLVSELGRGASGVVYRARDQAGGFEVALKVLSQHLSEKARERLRREGELTARLVHPGIVRVHSAGECDGRPYLAYELIEGARTIDDVFPELDRTQRVRLVEEVAWALGYAHAGGVVHRDVKPDNVLVDQAGRARLADFGLARAEGLDRLTRSGALVGTPLYMAPELVAGDRKSVGPHTDVWSLGVVLYQALTGARPFDGETLVALTHSICQQPPTSPRQLDRSVPADLEAICLKALAKEPGERYPDGAALAEDLASARASGPVSAQSQQWGRALRRGGRRALQALLVTALLVGVVVVLRGRLVETQVDAVAAFRQLLAGAEHEGNLAQLERALAEAEQTLPLELRAEAHLLLAARLDDAQARARHAELAAGSGAGDAARVALARAWTDAGRYAEAAAAWAAVGEPSDDQRLERLELLVLLPDEREQAVELAAEIASRRSSPRVLTLQARALAAAGRPEEAEAVAARLARDRPGPLATLLRAEVVRAGGEDPRPHLLEALARWPRRPEPWIARAEDLLERGLARAAQQVLADARAKLPDGVGALEDFVETLLAPPHMIAADARPGWRQAGLRWLLLEAERELAYVLRGQDPRYPTPAGAAGEEVRRARVELLIAAAGPHCAAGSDDARRLHLLRAQVWGPRAGGSGAEIEAALAIDPRDPHGLALMAERLLSQEQAQQALEALEAIQGELDDRSLVLKGRALRLLGRPREALEPLLAALGAWRDSRAACGELSRVLDDLGRGGEADAFRERARLLDGGERAQAEALWGEVGRNALWSTVSSERMAEGAERVLALDPLHYPARVAKARSRFAFGAQRQGLLESVVGCMRDPTELGGLFRSFLAAIATDLLVGDEGPSPSLLGLSACLDEGEPSDAVELARAWVLVMRIEVGREPERVTEAARLLGALIERHPAVTPLYLLRGFCELRQGYAPESRRDLDLVDREYPGVGQAAFYRALLLAGGGAPAERVLAELERARGLRCHPWTEGGWGLDGYPELEGYLKQPAFRPYRGR